MRYMTKAMLASVASLTLAGAANAALIDFRLTGSYTAHFQIDANPTVVDPDEFGFVVQNVIGNFPSTSVGYAADVSFFTADNLGGLEIDDPYGDSPRAVVVSDGPQLFTGSTSNPTFTLGTFDLAEYMGDGTYTLVISNVAAAVPEPSTWALAILGFGAIGVAMRRSSRNVSVRFAG